MVKKIILDNYLHIIQILFMKKMMTFVKFMTAILLLFCLAPMPYGYYQLVMFVAMVVFAIIAFDYYKEKKNELSIIFGALALLFQPFF